MKLPRLLRPWRDAIREPRPSEARRAPGPHPAELEPLLLTDFVEPERPSPAAH